MPELIDRYNVEHYSGMVRPDPNINTPSRFRSQIAHEDKAPKAFRGSYNVTNIGGTNGFQQVLSDNVNRCYLEISNQSDVDIQFQLGSNAGIVTVPAFTSWWSPVAPVDSVSVNVPAGKTCTIISALD